MTLNIISNFAANTALRNLQINGDEAAKSVGKLSSGSRVVTAADDAAALAIGTRLNTEVQSLEQASINAGQAVSLLQIGDGGLSRLQEMMTRMKTLAVQAGSDNLSNTERALLDTEYQNLKLEIDRLTKDTKFNGIPILATPLYDGSTATVGGISSLGAFGGADFVEDVNNTNGLIEVALRGADNRSMTEGGDGEFTVTIIQLGTDGQIPTTSFAQASAAGPANITTDGPAATPPFTQGAQVGQDLHFAAIFHFGNLDGNDDPAGNDFIVKRAKIDGSLLVQNGGSVQLGTGVTLSFGNEAADFTNQGGISKETAKNVSVSISIDHSSPPAAANVDLGSGGGLFGELAASIQIGADNRTDRESGAVDFDFKVGTGIIADEDEINIKIGGMTVEALGLTNTDLLSKQRADISSEALAFSLDYLVNIRADIGASVNRLETASDNIAISMEMQEAARSRLLDLNVAAEITTFTSKQILLQSGISVLAQANQLPQNLLRLFA